MKKMISALAALCLVFLSVTASLAAGETELLGFGILNFGDDGPGNG